jgi:multidrug efflux pump subunit AcrB
MRGNIFWVVMFALLTSWCVAVVFTPYLGVKLLPDIKPVPGGHEAIYSSPNYRRLRRLIGWVVTNRKKAVIAVASAFVAAVFLMSFIKVQFFPISDRPEVLLEVQMPEGTSINETEGAVKEVEEWLKKQP